jgi:hypothetical protein
MNKKIISRALFIGRSLLWSLLFYVVTMVAINWDEFSNNRKQDNGRGWVQKTTEKELIPMEVSAQEPGRQVFVIKSLKVAVVYLKTAADFLF